MREVDIEIFQIAKTKVDRDEVRRWLDHMGADAFEIPTPDVVSDPALLVALAAKRCYMSFEPGLNPNVTKVRKDIVDYLDNVLKQKHGSVFEHGVYTFAIEGVSRVFTAEMNRHRAGWAISEGSMRYIRLTDIPFWMPECFRPKEGDDPVIVKKKLDSQALMRQAFSHDEQIYGQLLDIWDLDSGNVNFHYKKIATSAFRRVVGMGVATGGVWTGNIRALRHVMAMRASEAAEEEIFHVFSRITQMMIQEEPALFSDFESDGTSWIPKYLKV